MKLKFLGTGTSQGVPVIGCTCNVCISMNPKDKRFRASAMITTDSGKKILIDCGPDFRMQMLNNNEANLDAILITHEHNDHVIGLDDIRPIIFKNKKNTPIYCLKRVGTEIETRFPYAFAKQKYPGSPSFDLFLISNEAFELFDVEIIPIEVLHYQLPILGYKLGNLAYITDASSIESAEKEKLKNLDILILNCIRKEEPHPAHFILSDIIKINNELKPKVMYLTHISHDFGLHDTEESELPKNIHLAFDGLELIF